MIIDKLITKIIEMNNPTVVGLDPKLDFIPKHIINKNFELYGESLKAVAECFYDFNVEIINEIYDIVPAVKPQVAMYEQLGATGFDCYIRTIEYAKSKQMIVIGDVKRGDIQSTAEAYSDGHLGKVNIGQKSIEVYKEDFITLNPYLGSDSIIPYLKNCEEFEKGLFILVKTSNPQSGDFQNLIVDNMKLYEKVGLFVNDWGKDLVGSFGFSSVGAVVGATYKEEAQNLRKILPNTFFLVPGYGAQGGRAEDLKVCFNEHGIGAIVNSSRGIIAAYKQKEYSDFSEENFAKASRSAAINMKNDLNEHINM